MKIMRIVILFALMATGLSAGELEEFLTSPGVPKAADTKPGYIRSTGEIPNDIIRLQGGDNIASATPITTFPAYFTGTTVGYTNDYDETCPFDGNIAPDVVYSYMPDISMMVRISLCESEYDTKVYVFEETVGNTIACNDDGCGLYLWRSEISNVYLSAGITYYIVIDGQANAQGIYYLELTEPQTCQVQCPPNAIPEDEPLCYDEYEDISNIGCSAVIWDTISSNTTICGTSGTYLYEGMPTRDADWFEFSLDWESAVHLEGEAEFPYLLMLIRQGIPEPCYFEITKAVTALPCSLAVIDTTLAAGKYWVWAGSTEFEGIDCGSQYYFTLENTPTASCVAVPGDANGNGTFNGLDVGYSVGFFKGSDMPPPVVCNCPPYGNIYAGADANGNCAFNGLDVTYMVNWLKGIGPYPVKCSSCPPGLN